MKIKIEYTDDSMKITLPDKAKVIIQRDDPADVAVIRVLEALKFEIEGTSGGEE